MNRKVILLALFFLFVLLFVISNDYMITPTNITGMAIFNENNKYKEELENKLLNNIYTLNTNITKATAGNINMYLPKFTENNFDKAVYYANSFGMEEEMTENDEMYIFKDENAELQIFKYMSLLKYVNHSEQMNENKDTLKNDKEALSLAEKFFLENLLFLNYEEAIVTFDKGIYDITFIERLNNIKKFSFTNRIQMDSYGNILALDYYFFTYERLNTCPISSPYEAFLQLPIDFPEDTEIQINNCQLVYYYDNSIIQPAYLFEGLMNSEKSYECFIKAANFN